jgi:L-2-hydroxyglutarate oxidase LhgO
VHVTVSADGGVWLGPTATPVLGGEQYSLLETTAREAVVTAARLALLLSKPHNTGLRRLAVKELRLRSRRALVREGSRLARGLPSAAGWKPGRPGIRAQLVDTVRWKLQDDFVYEAGEGSCHVLNAVSPAFTCALPLSEYLVDTMSGVRKQ